ncbi:BREX system serine/threonine kinase PglW [Azoarcus indigens]|uniref:Serine/threonine protein kinase n=1 Tax=Azoarcus indigens TaxID=29545 RepID=A0A4R6EG56_9RHOO|nr:BREX system serine/threonine kinase PglW [Azoarcus indigens]NMG63800.1 BREX system serine/threonine kinase PglW [Azoarcus indigens]TDN56338.1 serine/threonine protein kinase [Azoarcus indigens]
MTSRWKTISPSQFPWEQNALDFIQRALPNREPFRAYSNFEFVADDGSINEVDLLVVSRYSIFLVEIKSRPGEVGGDSHTWIWRDGAREYFDDNPLLLTNRKAKKLASLLRKQLTVQKRRTPYIQSLVFLSDPGQRCKLTGPARENVHLRADIAGKLFNETAPVASAQPIDRDLATSINRALEAIGIRPPQQSRRVGDYQLEQVLAETDFHQDWLAKHVSLNNLRRRVRLYTAKRNLNAAQRSMLADAARREFQLLEGIRHPGILRASDFIDSEHGPALIFDYEEGLQRLDHFIRAQGEHLDLWQRLKLVRAIAEALDAAHRYRLYHRGLSPQTIMVRTVGANSFDVTLFDWQIATRQLQEAEGETTGTLHVEMLSDRVAQEIYLAPEARIAPRPDAIKLDLFSLGAISYFVLAGEPPAVSGDELVAKCEQGPGLTLSALVNGCLAEIEDLIQFATWPSTEDRFGSTGEFLVALDKAEEALEDALTAPASPLASPLEANAGNELHGFEVVRRLGKGGTSLALEVRRKGAGQPRQGVFKIALEAEYNERLKREAETLVRLQPHQNIVQCFERFEIAGLATLFLSSAGEETLGERLRQEGRLGLDLLQRFGEELISVVEYLEREGVPHRDIKPDNIGIRPGAGKRLTLTLFDFSLAGVPASDLNAGTRVYMDPFLRKRGMWDGYAERYSCALTLHEMAAGTLPEWGDGSADPATLKSEIILDSERFDASIRQQALEFFSRALARDHRKRFDNAEQMLRAWRKVFENVSRPVTAHTTNPPQGQLPFGEEPTTPVSGITPTTPLESLELDSRHLELIDRIGHDELSTAGDLADLPRNRLYRHRGIALAVARELHQIADRLRHQFSGGVVRDEQPADTTVAKLSVDAAAALLVPKKGDEAQLQALEGWLGLAAGAASTPLAEELLQSMAERMSRQPEITHLRDDVALVVAGLGGIATVGEIASALLARRGSVQTGETRHIEAVALTRAVVTVERTKQAARWQVVQRDSNVRPLVQAPQADDLVVATLASSGASGLFPSSPEVRASYAVDLGDTADRLAQLDPLPSAQQVADALARIQRPAGDTSLSSERMIRLAAACARQAALSSRLEFYPVQLPAARAVKLATTSLLGLRQFDIETIRRRVFARYPEAAPLPGPTDLETLLKDAGLDVRWDGVKRAFVTQFSTGVISGTTQITRLSTNSRPRTATAPDIQAALQIDERIRHALASGKLLTLSVDPKGLPVAQRELAQRFGLKVIDFDEVVLTQLEAQAREWEVDWNVLLAADAAPAGSVDAQNFATVLGEVWPKVEAKLLTDDQPGLLVNLGLAARWQRMPLFARLADACMFGQRPPLIALIASPMTPDNRPVLDGQAVPVTINTTDYGRIPRAWLENAHGTPGNPSAKTRAKARKE